MKPELRARIISYNKDVASNAKKAEDMQFIASEISKLPKGQLKKILGEDVCNVFRKYGVSFD